MESKGVAEKELVSRKVYVVINADIFYAKKVQHYFQDSVYFCLEA